MSTLVKSKVDKTELFRNAPIPKAVFALAIPTVLNQMITTIYNLVDTYFVGQIGDSNMVAAVSVASSAMILMTAAGNLFGIGGGSYISRCLGAGDREKAKRISSFCNTMCILVGFIVSASVITFLEPLSYLIGASDATLEYTKQYLFWTMGVGAIPTTFAMSIGNQIRAEGNARYEVIGMVSGHILNCILDPILIFTFNMGVKGAAIATMMSNVIASIYDCIFVFKIKGVTVINFKISNCKLDWETFKNIILVGLPAALNNVINSTSRMVLYSLLRSYSDTAVAAMGIVRKIDELPLHVANGFTQGVMPFVGYNYAAKNYKRMEDCRSYTFKITLAITITMMVVIEIFAPWIVSFFLDSSDVVEIGTVFLRIHAVCLPLMASSVAIRSTFQALGKGIRALIVTICRQGLIYVPVMLIMNKIAGMTGVVSSQIAADSISLLLAVFMYRNLRKEMSVIENTI